MNLKIHRFFITVIILFVLLPIIEQNETLLNAQQKERLLFEEIPVVITASRKEQPITEAPTTITVINADDIKYSGAVNIPDLLLQVAGVDTMTISPRDQQVGVRGFISPLNNKLLVLIDGRTMYTDLYGTVLWDLFPVGMEEIERIEVVKSPASSVYGANAFSGVINIITKSPSQLLGTTLQIQLGNQNTLIGTIIHAGSVMNKKLNYKVSIQTDRTDQEPIKPDEKTPTIFRANTTLIYNLNNQSKVTLSAGRSNTKNRKLHSGEYIGAGLVDYTSDYLQLDLQYKNWTLRSFYKKESPIVEWFLPVESQVWDINTYNLELYHNVNWGENHSLICGINFRANHLGKNSFIRKEQSQHLWSFFLDDEIKLSKKFQLTIGARYDSHPLAGGRISPRGNIIFSPSPKHIFRVSFAQAFRNPSFIESYLYIEKNLNIALPSPFPPIEIPIKYITLGNPELKPESVTAYEIGVNSSFSKFLKAQLNLFYNFYSDFYLSSRYITYYESNALFPGSPGGYFPKTIESYFSNVGSAEGRGGEIHLDFRFSKHISAFANYSYLEIIDKEDNPTTPQINEKNRIRPENPKHKINTGIRFIIKKQFSLNCIIHWAASTQRLLRNSNGSANIYPIKDILLINSRLGFSFLNQKAEIAVAVFNLLNKRQYQFPLGENILMPSSEPLQRKYTFSFTLKL